MNDASTPPAGACRKVRRPSIGGCAVFVIVLFGISLLFSAVAAAAVRHDFDPALSGAINRGVAASPAAAEATVNGSFGLISALNVDGGGLWVEDQVEGGVSRVDRFNDATGEFTGPQLNEHPPVGVFQFGVGVGHPGGEEEVYVGAGMNSAGVVAVFGPGGALQGTWTGAATPNKSFVQDEEGEFVGDLNGVAVDGSGSFETGGDVYVATGSRSGATAFDVVDVFHPLAGGGEPASLVGQLTGTCTVAGSVCSGAEVLPFTEPSGVAVSNGDGEVFVTDARGVVDVFAPAAGKYEFVRQLAGAPTGAGGAQQGFGEVVSVAVDGGSGEVYVVDGGRGVVDEFDAGGEYVGRLTGAAAGPFENLRAVAVDASSHRVYVTEFNEEHQRGSVDVFDAGVVVPDVVTGAVSGVGIEVDEAAGVLQGIGVEASLAGTVNPDAEGEALCGFAYGTTGALGLRVACEPEGVADGTGAVAVHGIVHGLAPDTNYVYRLQASNHGGLNPGEDFQDGEFVTPGPGVHSESVSSVASTSATLQASVDPNGAATSFYFEYGLSAGAYEGRSPAAAALPLGSGHGDVQVAPRHVQGLAAGSVYHYRVVAVSDVDVAGETRAVAFMGPDQTFRTQGAGTNLQLADGRQWEQVSPVDKRGGFLEPIGETGGPQAAASGGAIAYLASVPTEADAKGYVERVQVLSSRGSAGWASQNISLAHAGAAALSGSYGPEYRLFSPDLTLALVEPLGEYTSLGAEAFPPDTDRTPYLRANPSCTTPSSGCFEPLVTGAEGYADVPAGTPFGGLPSRGPTLTHGEVTFVGASKDLAHVILDSPVALTSVATGGREELYEWSAGAPATQRIQLVSVLPETGEPAPSAAGLGLQNQITRDAVSADGSRVVWAVIGGHLYLTDTSMGQAVRLDVARAGGGESDVGPRFQAASSDGSRVFFTDTERLTADSRALSGRPDLYVCDIVVLAGALRCELTDLTPGHGEEAANVQGAVVGGSEDGNWVYYVADGALAAGGTRGACEGAHPPAGVACGLYVSHFQGSGWQPPRLIANLSGDDFPDWTGDGGTGLNDLTARVSPDGHWVAFMSELGLTGYDTRDAVSGAPDEEVYLYSADASGGAGRLVCASCDPTGARPVGVPYAQLNDKLVGGDRIWNDDQWIAANVPGWTAHQLGRAAYQSRYLSDAGRLFFNSSDGLVAQDGDGTQDVYEFEPAGVGDCSSASPSMSGDTGGCLRLISSGRAAGESAFMDASESGDDVFFLTNERLVSGDVDTAGDLYDAHVCSSAAPCSTASTPPPPCVTADSCRAAPEPEPSIFGSPSSATFSGAGNLKPAAAPLVRPKPKTRALTRAQKLAKALKACKKKPKRQRAACRQRARRTYRRSK